MPIIREEDYEKAYELNRIISELMRSCEISIRPLRCGRRSRCSCMCLFKPIFGSTHQMSLILAKTFEGFPIKIPTNDDPNVKIDSMFFTATCEPLGKEDARYKRLPTFLLCNPNAMFYQFMVNQPHAYYLRYFLNKNINVMLWNYRGYGLTKGNPTPANIRRDGEQILRYMRNDMGLTGKMGVYGRSLGGVVTSHLADQVDFIFADRTFSNFEILADRKFYSGLARYLFLMSSGGWHIDNDLAFFHKGVGRCHKVMMTEKADEVVEMHSSLTVGVAREVLGRKHLEAGQGFYLSLTTLRNFITAA